ncbi:MAG: molybdopterin-guanine dinucleotide biosynthesis protein B [Ectobacillus sp.]
MAVKPVILQIVGYQNSGKTTAAEKIIRALTEAGYKVGSFKHHGHGGKPDIPEKDSTRHLQAGAVIAGVEGDGLFLFTARGLDDWLALYRHLHIDVVIIEGYKQKPYHKIVCVRSEEDKELLNSLTNIQAVLSWIPVYEHETVFSIQDEEAYLAWCVEYVRREMECMKS